MNYRFISTTFLLLVFISHALEAGGQETEKELFSLTRQECRDLARSPGGSDLLIDCLETGVYDPCDDGGSRWGFNSCYSTHMALARKRIENANSRILAASKHEAGGEEIEMFFQSAEERFDERLIPHCQARHKQYEKFSEIYGQSSTTPAGVDSGSEFTQCRLDGLRLRANRLEEIAREKEQKGAQLRPKELLRILQLVPFTG